VSLPEVSSEPSTVLGLPQVRKGQVVGGKYQIDALIGTGAMGYVVSANHIDLGQPVALKFLRPELLSDATLVARFASEARAVAKIRSEHVARVFDVGALDDGAPFIVMELLTGKDLAQLLAEPMRMRPETAVGFVLQACEALAIAHSCGIVHRDIKPENLFLAQTMQGRDVIKVLDFGISKLALTGSAVDCALPLVRTMAPLGSPLYMSPEQIRALGDIDGRTDIWSIGCVLFELLAGRAAFDAASITQLCATILEHPAPSVRQLRGDVPPELDAVISRCLEKQREHRYPDVAELAAALLPFASAASRISVERCCYILRKSALTGEDEAHESAPSSRGSGSAPSLRPATIDRANLRITVAEESDAARLASSPKRRASIAAGMLLAFALVLGVWRLHPFGQAGGRASASIAPPSADATSRAGALAAATATPSGSALAQANRPVSTDRPTSAISAAPLASSLVSPSTSGASRRSETKNRRTQGVGSSKHPRTAPEPDVGF
jgi:serine/threonine protein kinase